MSVTGESGEVPIMERGRLRRKAAIRIGGSIAVLVLLVTLLPRDKLVAAFGRLPAVLLVVAIPGYLTLHLAGVFKWRLLVNAASGGLNGRQAVRCYYSGLFGSTFLPSIVGGDFVRVGLAMRLAGSKAGVLLGSVLDRTLDVIALAGVAGIGALLAPRALPPESRQVWFALATVVGVTVALGILAMAVVPAHKLPLRARRIMVKLRQRGRELARCPGRVATALAVGMMLQATLAMFNAWIGTFIGIEVPIHVWLFVWPMAKVSALVPVTQGGIGVREATLAALFTAFGVPAVLAVAAGLAFQGVVIGGGLTAGVVAFLLGRMDHVGSSSAAVSTTLETGEEVYSTSSHRNRRS